MNALKRLLGWGGSRHVLVHMHYFKNAGTTVDWALEHCFGDRFGTTDELDRPSYQYTPAEVEAFLRKHPKYCAVASHQFRTPFPTPRGMDLHPFTFVRHPIDRVFSVYAFEQKQGDATPGGRKASRSTLEEYVEWRLGRREFSVIHNFHVSSFLRTETGVAESSEALEVAQRQWRLLTLGGVVERLDESLVLLEERMRPFFPELDLAYVRQNTSEKRAATLEERVEQGLALLPQHLQEELLERNQMDQAFYKWAVAELEEALSGVPRFEEKLKAFRERCQRLVES